MEIREEAPFPGHCTHQNCGQNLVSVGLGWVISGREVRFCFLAHWDSSPEKALAILTEQWWTIYVRGCICWMDALCFCNLSRALSFSVPFSQSEFWEIFPMKAFKSIIKNYRLFKNNYISRIAFFLSLIFHGHSTKLAHFKILQWDTLRAYNRQAKLFL